jgi:hypothetical protein
MSRLPPIPEEVQRNSRNRLRPFFRFGVGLIVLGIAAAVSGLVGVTGDAIESTGWALVILGLVYMVCAKFVPKFADNRPYGSSRRDPPVR